MGKILALTILALAACAPRPDAIAPIAVPVPSGCSHAALAQERQNLSALSAQQNSAATNDAIGVFLFGVPMSSLAGGDIQGQIAVSKGKVLAYEAQCHAQ